MRISSNQCSGFLYYSVVYASSQSARRKYLWQVLGSLSITTEGLWLLVGEFNAILDNNKRISGAFISPVRCKWFWEVIFDNTLRDFSANGARFTWSRGGLSQRLDKALCNSY